MKLEGWETLEDIEEMYIVGDITEAEYKKEIKKAKYK